MPRLRPAGAPEREGRRWPAELDAALDLAARFGWKVFPVTPGEKRPALKGWQAVASDSPTAWAGWWGDSGTCRDTLVGVMTGEASGIWVLDADVKNGGPESLARAEAESGSDLGAVLVASTPSGGTHRFYAYPDAETLARLGVDRARNRAGVDPGVDVRGQGGLVVAPGQQGRAVLGEVRDPEPAPEWVASRYLTPRTSERTGAGGPSGDAERFVLPERVPSGQHDSAVFRWASSCRGRSVPLDAALAQAPDVLRRLEGAPGCGDHDLAGIEAKVRQVYATYTEGPPGRDSEGTVPDGSEPESGGKPPSTATLLVGIALEGYDLGRTPDGDLHVVPKEGGRVRRVLRRGFGEELAAAYYKQHGSPANASARADAMAVLAGMAAQLPPEEASARAGRAADGSIHIDGGDEAGWAVRVAPGGWEVLPRSPVLFARTNVTGAFPRPERGGDLADFAALLNVAPEEFDLLVSFVVAAWVPGIAHPVLLLTAEQGAAKTTTSELISTAIDPSPAPKRKAPRDEHAFTVSVEGSLVANFDNLSDLPPWFSDAICRAATGEGDVRRELYADKALVVSSYRRVIMLNGIGVGAVRGDLADRLIHLQLRAIPPERRLEAAELHARFERLRPALLGALLDVLAGVLRELAAGTVTVPRAPRMLDFARVARAVDLVRGTASYDAYMDMQDGIAAQVLEGDPLIGELLRLAEESFGGILEGSAAEILERLDRKVPSFHKPAGWPKNPTQMGDRLRRNAPALRQSGYVAEQNRGRGGRKWRVGRVDAVDAPPQGSLFDGGVR